MTKMRVYEYAKQNNMTSKAVIQRLNDLNIEVSNHMSTITAETKTKLEEKVKKQSPNNKNEQVKKQTPSTNKQSEKNHSPKNQGNTNKTKQGQSNKPQQNQNKKDRKSTRLNSSHVASSYAVFCLKKKRQQAKEVKA